MKPIDLGKAREERKAPCDYCGEEEHKGAFQCPRIKSVTFDNEQDTVTVRLYGSIDIPGDGPRVA